MSTNSKWPQVLRIVWSTGGIVAINEPGTEVKALAGIGGGTVFSFTLQTYPSLYGALTGIGLPVIGTTFVVDQEEVKGIRPPEFRTMGSRGGWPIWDTKLQWRQIASAAARSDEMQLMDVASRIASGLLYSQLRMRDLVSAYSSQLASRLASSKANEYVAFSDMNSFSVYMAIHALFWEMAVLRDALSEFASVFCFSISRVTSFSGLIKQLRKGVSTDPLASKILAAADEQSGWLARFTDYRNCFTHVAPMEQATNLAFAIQDFRELRTGGAVPQIYYPLPENVQDLMKKRTKGPLFSTFKDLAMASTGRHARSKEPDSLEYLHTCLLQMTEMSKEMVVRSPIAPRPLEIRPEDIRGPIQFVSACRPTIP